VKIQNSRWGEIIFIVIFLFAAFFRLDAVPPVWWDEGWTLSVARNWLEFGHYGRLLEGQLVSPGLEAWPTVTASVYLSFRAFGIGVVQARLVGVVFTLASVTLLYYLALYLFNRATAVGTLLVITLLPAYAELFPVYFGRQVLGEMPALFFLLCGYVCFLFVTRHSILALTGAIIFWSLGLATKLQAVPFWACSMMLPMAVLVIRRDWRSSTFYGVGLVGSFTAAYLLSIMWGALLRSKTGLSAPITGLYEVTAAVGSVPSRMVALIVTVLFGLPTLLGLIYNSWRLLNDKDPFREHAATVRFSLLVLAGSWFAWFMCFSVGWVRYVFPATFIGSIFVAAMIYDLSRGCDVAYTIQQSLIFFKGRGFNKEAVGALLILVIVATSAPRTAMALYKTYVLDADTSVQQVAEFLNSQTRAAALIETYDSELFFLLNRPYHYPLDQIHVELIRRTFLYDDNTIIHYDPLAANPDYLVVGPHSKQWRLYEPVLRSGAFRLLRSYARYQIYERVR